MQGKACSLIHSAPSPGLKTSSGGKYPVPPFIYGTKLIKHAWSVSTVTPELHQQRWPLKVLTLKPESWWLNLSNFPPPAATLVVSLLKRGSNALSPQRGGFSPSPGLLLPAADWHTATVRDLAHVSPQTLIHAAGSWQTAASRRRVTAHVRFCTN